MDWDEYFMLEAYTAASKSKDTRTQVGACVVGPDKEIRSKGYNGPCRGEDDNNLLIYEKPLKNYLMEHAERNAIYNLARVGISGKGCTIYCTLYPCVECARAIIQTGMLCVVVHDKFSKYENLNHSQIAALELFGRLKISVRFWTGNPKIISIINDGIEHHFHKEITK